MTNWITVPYETTGAPFVAAYESFMNERPMKIDADSKPLSRKESQALLLAALGQVAELTRGMREGMPFDDPRRARGIQIVFTASRDIKAEGVTRAQKELIKPIAEMRHLHAAVGRIEDPAEAYKFAVSTILEVLSRIGLAND